MSILGKPVDLLYCLLYNPPMPRYTRLIALRLTEAEYAYLMAESRKWDMTLSDVVRQMIHRDGKDEEEEPTREPFYESA